jgi:hypothetical protein
MLWVRTVGRRAAVATSADAIERRMIGEGTSCPRFEEESRWDGKHSAELNECSSKHELFVAPELLAAR